MGAEGNRASSPDPNKAGATHSAALIEDTARVGRLTFSRQCLSTIDTPGCRIASPARSCRLDTAGPGVPRRSNPARYDRRGARHARCWPLGLRLSQRAFRAFALSARSHSMSWLIVDELVHIYLVQISLNASSASAYDRELWRLPLMRLRSLLWVPLVLGLSPLHAHAELITFAFTGTVGPCQSAFGCIPVPWTDGDFLSGYYVFEADTPPIPAHIPDRHLYRAVTGLTINVGGTHKTGSSGDVTCTPRGKRGALSTEKRIRLSIYI